jgi:hypothetical protein
MNIELEKVQEIGDAEDEKGAGNLLAAMKVHGQAGIVEPSACEEYHDFTGDEDEGEKGKKEHGKVDFFQGALEEIGKEKYTRCQDAAAYGRHQYLVYLYITFEYYH